MHHDAPINVPMKNFSRGQAAGAANDDALSRREKSVTARERVSDLREEAADQRDSVAKAREDVIRSHEQTERKTEVLTSAIENQTARLRQANEQLVITTVEAQKRMDHMAHHDALTGLPNRIMLKERLIQAIALAKRHGTKLAVLFIDLDRFKSINDSLGHAVGDTVLQLVAQRLRTAMRGSDTVSRHGGDEFVVLLSEVADENAVRLSAEKLCKVVTAPYPHVEQDLYIGATIGISMYPDDGEVAETLIGNADVAMYHGKHSGRDMCQFFRAEMNARAIERQSIEGDLRRAIERQEFQLYYQVQVEFRTGTIIGVEALIRWRHPTRGLLLPAVFIPIAETCGAITAIGRWALREACRQTQIWLDAGMALDVVAVNISAVEFAAKNFVANVRSVLCETRLEPHHLELELTETVLMKDAESTLIMLRELKSMGVRIAIDDFGTGYSSLSYLRQFPVDTLKIDKSFVAGIGSNRDDDILVDAVIGLGKSLRHRVIAEGVETREQLAFLSEHHCAEGQGNYLSSPMSAEQVFRLLKTGLTAGLVPRATSLH